MPTQTLKIYLTGVGGQGTLTATNILAHAFMNAKLDVIAGEVHGMAQRGGVVESFLLVGGLKAPRIDKNEADILLGFDALESLRGLSYLHKNGIILSSTDIIAPSYHNNITMPNIEYIKSKLKKYSKNCNFLPCRNLARKENILKCTGSILLGAFLNICPLQLTLTNLKNAVKKLLPPKLHEQNFIAFNLGYKEKNLK